MTKKNKLDFYNSFDLLNTYVELFEKGNYLLYLPMAVELRKLLCEKQPSPLITRIIPDFQLYELNSTKIFRETPSLLNGLVNFMPGIIRTVDEKTTIFCLSFSQNKTRINLDEWLSQLFFKENITIDVLIKSVADKEAAHADEKYNDALIHCNLWSFNDTKCHILGIYGIAKFINDLIRNEYAKYLI